MHKSKLAGFIIDCRTDDLSAAADFWAAALGLEKRCYPAGQSDNYIQLVDPRGELSMEVQQVDHDSRVHLDIESDDIDAEADRLVKLGAKKIQKIKRWWVMEAPTGQRFCVVRPQSREFAERANRWE